MVVLQTLYYSASEMLLDRGGLFLAWEKHLKWNLSIVLFPHFTQICCIGFLHSKHWEYPINSSPQVLQILSGNALSL